MENFDLKNYLAEGKLFEAAMACPVATQDLEVNTRNRDASIKADYIKYGPLNVDEPGDYWVDLAEYWDTTLEAAKKHFVEIVLLLISHLGWMNVCPVKYQMMRVD